jgi:hypothetical protein
LTFSLEHEVGPLLSRTGGNAGGGDAAAAGGGGGGGGAEEGGDLRARIRAILGGHPGGPALVASLYRPVLSFAEAADRHISSVTGQLGAEPGGRMAALLSMPWRGGAGEGPGSGSAAAAERTLLRSYVESFLRMEFLPAVYVSTRWVVERLAADGWQPAACGRFGLESSRLSQPCPVSLDLQQQLTSCPWTAAAAPAAGLGALPHSRMPMPSSPAPACAPPTRLGRGQRGDPCCPQPWPQSKWWRSCLVGRRRCRRLQHT